MDKDSSLLQVLHEVREDIRASRKIDQEEHSTMFRKLDDMDKRIDQHEKYWSITFFVGKIIAWAIASTLALIGAIKGFWNGGP